jgi:hypothetical protein
VALVRLGAVTHSVNMEQRYVPLSFTTGGGAINATGPANANVAPPGVYMLFVIGAGGVPSVARMVEVGDDTTPPATTITAGPGAKTNDPTPSFAFSSSEAGSSFECRLDSGSFGTCSSPYTAGQLADGSHTFQVRAIDPAGNADPTPAQRSFTLVTASVSVSGTALVVTAAPGAKDNLAIARPSSSTLRVTDLPSGSYTGSGVHAGAGCTRSGDYTANCSSAGITLIQVASGDQTDRVVNSNAIKASLAGGPANDVLTGGSNRDTLTGGTGADLLKGMAGGDLLKARDAVSDTLIGCGAGTDKANLDLLPKDPDSMVSDCETKTRH